MEGQPISILEAMGFGNVIITTKHAGIPDICSDKNAVFVEKKDVQIGYPRTEYHCKKCGGHHGHIFEDGPKPTGKRYCNNGVCLIFK